MCEETMQTCRGKCHLRFANRSYFELEVNLFLAPAPLDVVKRWETSDPVRMQGLMAPIKSDGKCVLTATKWQWAAKDETLVAQALCATLWSPFHSHM